MSQNLPNTHLYSTTPWETYYPAYSQRTPITPTAPPAGSVVVADVPELRQICQDVGELRAHLSALQKESELQDLWCHVGYVLDFLLFRIYLLLITCYALVIIYMWCIWISQT